MFEWLWRRRLISKHRYHLEMLTYFIISLVGKGLLEESWYYDMAEKYKLYVNADHLSPDKVSEAIQLCNTKISSLIKEK